MKLVATCTTAKCTSNPSQKKVRPVTYMSPLCTVQMPGPYRTHCIVCIYPQAHVIVVPSPRGSKIWSVITKLDLGTVSTCTGSLCSISGIPRQPQIIIQRGVRGIVTKWRTGPGSLIIAVAETSAVQVQWIPTGVGVGGPNSGTKPLGPLC